MHMRVLVESGRDRLLVEARALGWCGLDDFSPKQAVSCARVAALKPGGSVRPRFGLALWAQQRVRQSAREALAAAATG